MSYRDPLPHNVCQQFHPLVWVHPYKVAHEHSDILRPGWDFNRKVGQPWPKSELLEMLLQGEQIKRIVTLDDDTE